MFPSQETVNLFETICSRDGLAFTITKNISKKNPKYKPVMDYLYKIKNIIGGNSVEEAEKYECFTIGFLCCFHLFRLQIEAEDYDIEDYEKNIESLNNYINFLEEENKKYKESQSNCSAEKDQHECT
jgi:hypothetical protein